MTSRNLNQSSAAGRRVLDIPKTGVVANTVPATGENGPGYLYNEVVTNSLTTEEISGRVTNTDLPAGWYAYTNSNLYVPPGTADGTYYLEYQVKINGVLQTGTGLITITIGGATPVPVYTIIVSVMY